MNRPVDFRSYKSLALRCALLPDDRNHKELLKDLLMIQPRHGFSRYVNFSRLNNDASKLQQVFKLANKELDFRVSELNDTFDDIWSKIRSEVAIRRNFIELLEKAAVLALPSRLNPEKVIKHLENACPAHLLHTNESDPEPFATVASSILEGLQHHIPRTNATDTDDDTADDTDDANEREAAVDAGANRIEGADANRREAIVDSNANERESVAVGNRKRYRSSLRVRESGRHVRRRVEIPEDQLPRESYDRGDYGYVGDYDSEDEPSDVDDIPTSNLPSVSTSGPSTRSLPSTSNAGPATSTAATDADADDNITHVIGSRDADEELTFFEKIDLLLKDFIDSPLLRIPQPNVVPPPPPPPPSSSSSQDEVSQEEFFQNMVNHAMECVICKLEYRFSEFITLGSCSHSICRRCISTICNSTMPPRCPICRKAIKMGSSISFSGRLIIKHHTVNDIKCFSTL